jgi:ABC-2 type transport system permease protein
VTAGPCSPRESGAPMAASRSNFSPWLGSTAFANSGFYHFNVFPMLPAFVPHILTSGSFRFCNGNRGYRVDFCYTTSFQTLVWSFAGLLMPLSCVFYPLDSLPHLLRPFAWALPTTRSFEGMRKAISNGGFSYRHFSGGFGLSCCYPVLAAICFRWLFESARVRGLLVKTG